MGIYAELFKMAADLFSAAAERGVENRVPEDQIKPGPDTMTCVC